MRCKICDCVLSTPNFDKDHDEYDPCDFCLSIIQDTLDGFKDNAFVSDGELPEEDTLWSRIQKEFDYEET